MVMIFSISKQTKVIKLIYIKDVLGFCLTLI